MMHIVDDNDVVLRVMREIVEAFDYTAKAFASSSDYLAYAQSAAYQPPEAVFCDVLMPGIDGFDLMHRVHAMHPDIRFIIISGEDHTVHESKQGACIYLLKPIRFEMLETTFEHLRQCRRCGPSHALARTWPDDRKHFDVQTAACPLIKDTTT